MKRLLPLLCVLALAACHPAKPWLMEDGTLAQGKMTLVESRYIARKPLEDLASSDISSAVDIYRRKGAGPIYIVIGYNDRSKGADPMVSEKKGMIATALAAASVAPRDVRVSTVPLDSNTPVALVAFDTLEAGAPLSCAGMKTPGLDVATAREDGFDYKLGCGVQSMMARQIAHPQDLEGVAGLSGDSDGGRLAAVIARYYRTGETRPFLPSYVISELAGSGS